MKHFRASGAKPVIMIFLKGAVTIAVFAVILSVLDVGRVFRIMAQADKTLFSLSLAIFIGRNVVAAYRQQLLLRYKNCRLGLPVLTRLYLIGAFFNLFLPSVIGGDVARGYYLYRYSGGKEETLSTLFIERYLGILAMMALAVLSLFIAFAAGINTISMEVMLVIFIVFTFGLTAGFLALNERMERLFEKLISRLSTRLARPLSVLAHAMSYGRASATLLAGFLASVGFQFLSIVSTYIIALSIHEDLPFIHYLILLPIVWILMMVPVSISGLGIREGAFLYLFSAAGMSRENALALSLLWLAQIIILGLIGGVVFFFESIVMKDISRFSHSL
ncbi:MAG: flippase-like domain-containing protein [Candidatus Latescibacteria bacterium]|nr:flippase-like domain-containing protein [Candidatus Latescibacterota bacterium]